MYPILVAENEETDRCLLRFAVKRAQLPMELFFVGDGREAVRYLEASGIYADPVRFPVPALILVDLNLPWMSGFEILKWMHAGQVHALTPRVVLTSSSRDSDRAEAMRLGADSYEIKPMTPTELLALVKGLYGRWLAPRPERESGPRHLARSHYAKAC